jgi:hypothetical protein
MSLLPESGQIADVSVGPLCATLANINDASLDGLADEVIEQSGGNYHASARLNDDQPRAATVSLRGPLG